mmetsp:Transcript_2599/g.4180  ORF Transcript_2599/g.4180 Transcript_2599/m.4180 type:complete len:87 (+) Transcript_2599:1002-1262(+)
MLVPLVFEDYNPAVPAEQGSSATSLGKSLAGLAHREPFRFLEPQFARIANQDHLLWEIAQPANSAPVDSSKSTVGRQAVNSVSMTQ